MTEKDERARADWPNLGRYHDQNDTVRAAGVPVEVVFLGDSITEGWLQKSADFFTRARVGRGISGQTTPQMLVRFRQDVIDLAPRAVHIMAGTNDIAGNTGPASLAMIQANFMSMTELARANGIQVLLASVPPAKSFFWRPQVQSVPQIVALNAWLTRYARDMGAIYVDYYAALADTEGAMKPGLAYDGVHPSEQGYAVMNPIAEEAIKRALAGRAS